MSETTESEVLNNQFDYAINKEQATRDEVIGIKPRRVAMPSEQRIKAAIENLIVGKYNQDVGSSAAMFLCELLNHCADASIRFNLRWCNRGDNKKVLVNEITPKYRLRHPNVQDLVAFEHITGAVKAFSNLTEEELIEFLSDHHEEYGTKTVMLDLARSLS